MNIIYSVSLESPLSEHSADSFIIRYIYIFTNEKASYSFVLTSKVKGDAKNNIVRLQLRNPICFVAKALSVWK